MENDPNFFLEGIVKGKDDLSNFEGPLSLILILLQKNKIEIRDIHISEILDQYLEYIDGFQQLNLEVASEFVQMASYLLYLKTKTLLAGEKEVSELEVLIESLEQLKARDIFSSIKAVVPVLSESYKTGTLFFSKMETPIPAEANEYRYKHEFADLLRAIYSAVSDSNEKPSPDIESFRQTIPTKIVYSVRDKSKQILNKVRLRNVRLNDLYSECRSKSEIVATFVSVLELCSIGSIIISVSSSGDGYELFFSGGDIDEIIEQIERNF